MKFHFFCLMILTTACAPTATSNEPFKNRQVWEMRYEGPEGQFHTVKHTYDPAKVEADVRTYLNTSQATAVVPQENGAVFFYNRGDFKVVCMASSSLPDRNFYKGTYTLPNNEIRNCSFYLL